MPYTINEAALTQAIADFIVEYEKTKPDDSGQERIDNFKVLLGANPSPGWQLIVVTALLQIVDGRKIKDILLKQLNRKGVLGGRARSKEKMIGVLTENFEALFAHTDISGQQCVGALYVAEFSGKQRISALKLTQQHVNGDYENNRHNYPPFVGGELARISEDLQRTMRFLKDALTQLGQLFGWRNDIVRANLDGRCLAGVSSELDVLYKTLLNMVFKADSFESRQQASQEQQFLPWAEVSTVLASKADSVESIDAVQTALFRSTGAEWFMLEQFFQPSEQCLPWRMSDALCRSLKQTAGCLPHMKIFSATLLTLCTQGDMLRGGEAEQQQPCDDSIVETKRRAEQMRTIEAVLSGGDADAKMRAEGDIPGLVVAINAVLRSVVGEIEGSTTHLPGVFEEYCQQLDTLTAEAKGLSVGGSAGIVGGEAAAGAGGGTTASLTQRLDAAAAPRHAGVDLLETFGFGGDSVGLAAQAIDAGGGARAVQTVQKWSATGGSELDEYYVLLNRDEFPLSRVGVFWNWAASEAIKAELQMKGKPDPDDLPPRIKV